MSFPVPPLPDHSRLIEEGYAQLAALREQGINPYAWRYERTHLSGAIHAQVDALCIENPEAADNPADKKVRVAGRVMQLRKLGSVTFFHLLDHEGLIQICVKKGGAAHEQLKAGIEMGDIIGVAGPVFRTRTGEVTIFAEEATLLTKSVRPLKVKGEALKDVDARHRQRYADLIVNDEARETFRKRSKLIKALRGELDRRGYMEVETPMMQTIPGGAAARPFVTHHNTLDIDLYLRIAPELYLKRLVAGGFEMVYEINRNFRNEGISTKHNPEFTMLELYTAYWDYRDTMKLTEELLREAARQTLGTTNFKFGEIEIDFAQPFRRETILNLIKSRLGCPDVHLRWGMEGDQLQLVDSLAPDEYRDELLAHANTCDKVLLNIFETCVEDQLIQPMFVYDYPKSLCPLAKSKADDPATAERFELYIAGMEIANAYSELNDPAEQYEMFKRQMAERQQGDEEAQPMDEDYVRALEYGMPPASGLGIGIDRLAMLLTNNQSIREVILFPTMRPE